MYEATKSWVEQDDQRPSWERIVHVLRYKLVDPERADRIEGIFGLSELPNPLLEQPS